MKIQKWGHNKSPIFLGKNIKLNLSRFLFLSSTFLFAMSSLMEIARWGGSYITKVRLKKKEKSGGVLRNYYY